MWAGWPEKALSGILLASGWVEFRWENEELGRWEGRGTSTAWRLAWGLPLGELRQPGMSMASGMAGEGLATLASFLTVS